MCVRSRIREMLVELGNGAELTDRQDVFDTGIVSSLSLLQLICCLEDRFGIVVSQRDVFDGHLRSVERIVELVKARQA